MKTKLLVKEWKQFLNESAVIPLKLIKAQIKIKRRLSKKEQEAIFLDLSENWNKIYKKFSNVIFNDLNNTSEPLEHMLTALREFSIYYNTASDEMTKKIAAGTITSSDIRGFVESKKEAKKSENRTANRIKCRSKANLSVGTMWKGDVVDDARDFEVIYVGNDWTVVYPKSLMGSISWAVGLADGSEEKYEVDEEGTQIGRVTWCTASYENNRFPMYASNLHMYYFIKNTGYNINDIHRRLCISIVKHEENSEAVLYHGKEIVEFRFEGGATVNADNLPEGVSSIEEIESTVNNNEIIDLIKSHAATKKSTSIEEMASKITLPMLKQDEAMLADDSESLNEQIGIYLKYTNDEEVIDYIVEKYKEEEVHHETIYAEAPLSLKIFEREDIEKRVNEQNLINKLLKLYKNSEYISDLYNIMLYNSIESGLDIVDVNIKNLMVNYPSAAPLSHSYLYISELILTNQMHKLIDLNDIVKILTYVARDIDRTESGSGIVLTVILQEYRFSDYRDFKEYSQIKNLLKQIFPKLNDRTKRKILSNHNYIFENSILKKYIKLVLS